MVQVYREFGLVEGIQPSLFLNPRGNLENGRPMDSAFPSPAIHTNWNCTLSPELAAVVTEDANVCGGVGFFMGWLLRSSATPFSSGRNWLCECL